MLVLASTNTSSMLCLHRSKKLAQPAWKISHTTARFSNYEWDWIYIMISAVSFVSLEYYQEHRCPPAFLCFLPFPSFLINISGIVFWRPCLHSRSKKGKTSRARSKCGRKTLIRSVLEIKEKNSEQQSDTNRQINRLAVVVHLLLVQNLTLILMVIIEKLSSAFIIINYYLPNRRGSRQAWCRAATPRRPTGAQRGRWPGRRRTPSTGSTCFRWTRWQPWWARRERRTWL